MFLQSMPIQPRREPRPQHQLELPIPKDEKLVWSEMGPDDPQTYLGRNAIDGADRGEDADDTGQASYRRLKTERLALIRLWGSQEVHRLHRRRFGAELDSGPRSEEVIDVIRSKENRAVLEMEYEIRLSQGRPENPQAP